MCEKQKEKANDLAVKYFMDKLRMPKWMAEAYVNTGLWASNNQQTLGAVRTGLNNGMMVLGAGALLKAGVSALLTRVGTEAAESGPALARSLGQAGEDAVGITGPKTAIEIPGSGQIRIPDALTDTTLTEVKNVNSLSYTQQLRDFSTYSQQNGLNFELYVRPSTQLSGPLQQAVTNGQITLKFIPGAQ
jgi:hypothetical protein